MTCEHNNSLNNLGIMTNIGGFCPFCQPRCPCCGRPYYGYWPQAPTPYFYTTNLGQATNLTKPEPNADQK